jgi:hypothetical protein
MATVRLCVDTAHLASKQSRSAILVFGLILMQIFQNHKTFSLPSYLVFFFLLQQTSTLKFRSSFVSLMFLWSKTVHSGTMFFFYPEWYISPKMCALINWNEISLCKWLLFTLSRYLIKAHEDKAAPGMPVIIETNKSRWINAGSVTSFVQKTFFFLSKRTFFFTKKKHLFFQLIKKNFICGGEDLCISDLHATGLSFLYNTPKKLEFFPQLIAFIVFWTHSLCQLLDSSLEIITIWVLSRLLVFTDLKSLRNKSFK